MLFKNFVLVLNNYQGELVFLGSVRAYFDDDDTIRSHKWLELTDDQRLIFCAYALHSNIQASLIEGVSIIVPTIRLPYSLSSLNLCVDAIVKFIVENEEYLRI